MTSVRNDICCLRSCKVCNQTDATLNMLICDLCDESSHLSCCYPILKKVPVGEWWFCDSCLGKKLKESNPSIVFCYYTFWCSDLLKYGEPTETSHVECDCYQVRLLNLQLMVYINVHLLWRWQHMQLLLGSEFEQTFKTWLYWELASVSTSHRLWWNYLWKMAKVILWITKCNTFL